jgi:g-D-glutamyl-meso-diaminopimelate peptidase
MDVSKLGSSYTYEDLCADVAKLQGMYPFVEVITIGRSVEGRNIWALGMGSGPKLVHLSGGMHANEWITTPLLMKLCFDYCNALNTNQPIWGYMAKEIAKGSTIWVTPSVNPDGANLVQKGIAEDNPLRQEVLRINGGSKSFSNWKSNIRGVDLNHQFPANWKLQAAASPKNPSPRDHAGPCALSEPESLALANFTREKNFALVAAFHSQGEVIYWGYKGYEPTDAGTLAQELGAISGYRPIRYAGTHAGYKDWFIQDFRRPGFTIEVGRGANPLSLSTLPAIYNKLAKALLWMAK